MHYLLFLKAEIKRGDGEANNLSSVKPSKKIDMVERRNVNFWSKQVFALGCFEPEWVKVMKSELDFSCDGELDNHIEKTIGNRLILSGPLVDSYLEEMGKRIYSKLTRSKLTGLVPPITFFLPWEIMSKIAAYFVSYGSDIKNIAKGEKNDKLIIFCEKLSSAEKIFSPSRFDGTNYLRKRFFAKIVDPVTKVRENTYNGCAEVVFSVQSPLRIDYHYSSSKASISFYIQRYDKNDFSVDASLQKLLNGEEGSSANVGNEQELEEEGEASNGA